MVLIISNHEITWILSVTKHIYTKNFFFVFFIIFYTSGTKCLRHNSCLMYNKHVTVNTIIVVLAGV